MCTPPKSEAQLMRIFSHSVKMPRTCNAHLRLVPLWTICGKPKFSLFTNWQSPWIFSEKLVRIKTLHFWWRNDDNIHNTSDPSQWNWTDVDDSSKTLIAAALEHPHHFSQNLLQLHHCCNLTKLQWIFGTLKHLLQHVIVLAMSANFHANICTKNETANDLAKWACTKHGHHSQLFLSHLCYFATSQVAIMMLQHCKQSHATWMCRSGQHTWSVRGVVIGRQGWNQALTSHVFAWSLRCKENREGLFVKPAWPVQKQVRNLRIAVVAQQNRSPMSGVHFSHNQTNTTVLFVFHLFTFLILHCYFSVVILRKLVSHIYEIGRERRSSGWTEWAAIAFHEPTFTLTAKSRLAHSTFARNGSGYGWFAC